MAGALIVLPCTVNNHSNTTEILQTTDVDRGRRIVAAILQPHARHVVDEITNRAGVAALNLFERHHAHRRERVDCALLGLRRRDRDHVQWLLGRCADLRIGRGEDRVILPHLLLCGILLALHRLGLRRLHARLGRLLRVSSRHPARERNNRYRQQKRASALVQPHHDSPNCNFQTWLAGSRSRGLAGCYARADSGHYRATFWYGCHGWRSSAPDVP